MVALGVFSLFLLTPIAVYPLLSVTRVIEPIDCHSTYKVKIQQPSEKYFSNHSRQFEPHTETHSERLEKTKKRKSAREGDFKIVPLRAGSSGSAYGSIPETLMNETIPCPVAEFVIWFQTPVGSWGGVPPEK